VAHLLRKASVREQADVGVELVPDPHDSADGSLDGCLFGLLSFDPLLKVFRRPVRNLHAVYPAISSEAS